MTPGELDQIGAQPLASDPPRPLDAQASILLTKNVGATDRREFRQRARHGIASCRLRTKPLDCGLRSRLVAVAVHDCPRKGEVDPGNSGRGVALQPRIYNEIHHAWVSSELAGEAPADFGGITAQVHEMSHRSTR